MSMDAHCSRSKRRTSSAAAQSTQVTLNRRLFYFGCCFHWQQSWLLQRCSARRFIVCHSPTADGSQRRRPVGGRCWQVSTHHTSPSRRAPQLLVRQRILFNVAVTAIDSVTGPAYINLLQLLPTVYVPVANISGRSHLLSAERHDVIVPRTKTQLGRRSFHVADSIGIGKTANWFSVDATRSERHSKQTICMKLYLSAVHSSRRPSANWSCMSEPSYKQILLLLLSPLYLLSSHYNK